MNLKQAREIRAEIVLKTRPNHKARNISKRVMQTINNQREDVALYVLGGQEHLAENHIISKKHEKELTRALNLIRDE